MSETLIRQWRLLSVIPRSPRKADVPTLLSHLESAGHRITKRSLQRDLNMLSSLFPLQCDTRSVPYGWSWDVDAPSFDLPCMEGSEALMLKMIERFIPELLPPILSEYLRPYLRRAETVLQQQAQQSQQRWLDCVRVVPREMPLLPPKSNSEATRVVYQALAEGKRFTAGYLSRNASASDAKDYEINPLGLVVRGNLIYLVCTLWHYQDIRQLAMHRIQKAAMLEAAVTRPPDFDLDAYIRQGEFQYPVGPMIKLKVIFDREAAAHLYETPLSEDQMIEELDAERVVVSATVQDTKQLEWWLRGFGPLASVIEPTGLSNRVCMNIKLLAENVK